MQKDQYDAVRRRGYIPLVDWASYDYEEPNLLTQPRFSLSTIIAGQHDAYIRKWATQARAWGHPFFLRFDWEMNGQWFPWSERVLSDRPGRDSQRSAGASLDLRHAGWGGLELTSVTSVADSDIESSFDGDWGDAGPYDFFSQTLRTRKTFSEDLRLAGVIDAGTHWIAGAGAQRLEESNDQRDDGRYLADTFERELSSSYRATSAAFYGQVEARLADGLLLAGGLRAEQRDAVYEDSDGARFSPRDRMWAPPSVTSSTGKRRSPSPPPRTFPPDRGSPFFRTISIYCTRTSTK